MYSDNSKMTLQLTLTVTERQDLIYINWRKLYYLYNCPCTLFSIFWLKLLGGGKVNEGDNYEKYKKRE